MDIQDILKEERKVVYLLLHLGVPASQDPPSREHIREAKKAADKLGIKVVHIKVAPSAVERYVFRFPWYKREDARANHIAESLLYAVNITFGPIGDSNESAAVLPIPSTLVKDIDEISLDRLVELETGRYYEHRTVEFPGLSIGSSIHILDFYVTSAWKITPLLCNYDHLFDAARYLKESQDSFFVRPGQYDDVLHDSSSDFNTGWERGRLEIALLSAFKVVEALIGDPPSNDKKLIGKITAWGIDPYDEFGIDPRLPLFQCIRRMNKARDKSSAHGSISGKSVLIRDMFLYQVCAKFMLIKAIEYYLGEDLFAS